MTDSLTLTVNGTVFSGWTSIRVTRGIERMPSDFDIEMTERSASPSAVICKPGDSCIVKLGNDTVVTGFVNRIVASLSKDAHTIRVNGRSLSQDLVDCSAEWDGSQIANSNALQIAQKLAKPYGITVTATADPGPILPRFNVIIGESPYEITERAARFAGLIFFDKPDGSVVLAQTGSTTAASALIEGHNVQSASLTWTDDQLFAEYDAFLLAMNTLLDKGALNQPHGVATDPNARKRRKKFVVCESGPLGFDMTVKRARWEAARRHGRSYRVAVTVDSWRDGAKKLWEPNSLISVSLPTLKVTERKLCIGEVTFRLDERGTAADLVLMPPEAFKPEPILLLPIPQDFR